MNRQKIASITKLLMLLIVVLTASTFIPQNNKDILAKTSVDNQIQGPEIPRVIESEEEKEPDCDGLWMASDQTGKVFLNAIYLKDWGDKTNPSLILDTYEKVKNYLILGHNVCLNGVCDQARSQFSNIMKLKVGDRAYACVGGVFYSGYIFTSGPIPDTKVQVMGDWTGFNTITMFTSYGKCKDSACSSTEQRWLVAFERDK